MALWSGNGGETLASGPCHSFLFHPPQADSVPGDVLPFPADGTTAIASASRSVVVGSNPPGRNGSHSKSSIMGNIWRGGGGGGGEKAGACCEKAKNAGIEQFRRGNFRQALGLYHRAVSLMPGHAPYRSFKAAALSSLGCLAEAVVECQQALKLDPLCTSAHQILALLYLRLGLLERAKEHGEAVEDWQDRKRMQTIESHVWRCKQARDSQDWRSLIRESDAAVVSGADSATKIFGYKAEALLRLLHPEAADAVLSSAQRIENTMLKLGVITFPDPMLMAIRAEIDMSLGRFESAVSAAECAVRTDPCKSVEIAALFRKAQAVAQARLVGNELFKAGKFFEACTAYGEGLDCDPTNAVLLCNRAACRSKLRQWEKAIEDCDAAMAVRRNYTKALLRRADCHAKLERWESALRDYEELNQRIPEDMEVARGLFDVQVAIKKSRGEDVHKMKFGGAIEEILNADHFKEAITSPGLAMVQFDAKWSQKCRDISPFVDGLCRRFPSVNFLKVDVDNNPCLAKTENVSFVPTFKIYKNGLKVKEIHGPSQQTLEYAIRYYSL